MATQSSLIQRDLLKTTLRTLFVLLLLTGCNTSLSNIDLSQTALDPATTGFMVTGNAKGDVFGQSVSSAGDIDHDGYEDFIVGADIKNYGTGAAYVIYGGPTTSMSNIDLSETALDPATTGFKITGRDVLGVFGCSVSTAGDIDNDGYDDIIIGAYQQNTLGGEAYVIYGGPRSSMKNIDLKKKALDPAKTGFIMVGLSGSNFGFSVSKAGDINNDGYGDVLVGARGMGVIAGGVYVIYGGPRASMSNIDLNLKALDPATTGFMIAPYSVIDEFGTSVSTAGDINHDGYADIIIGAFKASQRGAAYVIYGGPSSSMSNIDLSTTTLDPLTTGFMIKGAAVDDQFGWSVSTAGDINNDGYDDIIVAAEEKNSSRGAAYVIYGGPRSSMSNIDLNTTTLDPAKTGFIITGSAQDDVLGQSVATAGDIDHDGYSDIMIGAYGAKDKAGTTYVIYGGPTSSMSNIDLSVTILDPATTGFVITGAGQFDFLGYSVNTAGDINHDGYDDILVAATAKELVLGTVYVVYGGPKPSMLKLRD